jgi:hypothetical protein
MVSPQNRKKVNITFIYSKIDVSFNMETPVSNMETPCCFPVSNYSNNFLKIISINTKDKIRVKQFTGSVNNKPDSGQFN